MIWKSCKRKILERKIRLSRELMDLYTEEKNIIRILEKMEKPKEESFHKGKAYAFSEVLKIVGE